MHWPNSANRSFTRNPDKGVSVAFENVFPHVQHQKQRCRPRAWPLRTASANPQCWHLGSRLTVSIA
jgi:hypothetical protein